VRCRLCNCKDREETVAHLTSECSKLAQLEYKNRRDKIAGIVHWSPCEKYGLPRSEQWYRHSAEPVIETEKVKILWDVNIQTDHVIEHRRPDYCSRREGQQDGTVDRYRSARRHNSRERAAESG